MKTLKTLWQELTRIEEEPNDTPPHIPDWAVYASVIGIAWYVYHVVSRIIELYF